MNWRKLPLVAALTLATVFVVGCGDNQNQAANSLTPADVMWLKQQRMQQMYGSTQTQTQTQTSTVTITNTTTVNVNAAH